MVKVRVRLGFMVRVRVSYLVRASFSVRVYYVNTVISHAFRL